MLLSWKGEVSTQLLAHSSLDFPLLEEPLPVTGRPGKMSFQSCVSFIEYWVEFPGEIYRLEIEQGLNGYLKK